VATMEGASTMLQPKAHGRILADFQHVCAMAGVQPHFMYESMTVHCGPVETQWVRKFWQYRAEGVSGMVLHGIARPDTRCQAMAAALVRNYIDARVIPMNTLIEGEANGLQPTVLIVPNLYLTALSKHVPAWRVQSLYDLLLERATKGKPSVVYVEALKGLGGSYGEPFRDFLSRFVLVSDLTEE
jgi:hypothetical protein